MAGASQERPSPGTLDLLSVAPASLAASSARFDLQIGIAFGRTGISLSLKCQLLIFRSPSPRTERTTNEYNANLNNKHQDEIRDK